MYVQQSKLIEKKLFHFRIVCEINYITHLLQFFVIFLVACKKRKYKGIKKEHTLNELTEISLFSVLSI